MWGTQAFVPIHCSWRGRNHISVKKVNFHESNSCSGGGVSTKKPLPAPLKWCLGPRTWFCSCTVKLGPVSQTSSQFSCHSKGQSPQLRSSYLHKDRNLLIKMPRWPQQVDWNVFYIGKENKSQKVITKLTGETFLPHTTPGNWAIKFICIYTHF